MGAARQGPERRGGGPRDETAEQAARHLYDYFLSGRVHERLHAISDDAGVPVQVAKVLVLLEPGVPKPMRALAQEWRCDASWVTALIDGVEEHGFAERRVHPQDRRVRTVELTPAGVRARQQLLDRLHEPPPEFAALDPEELAALRDILAKLLAATVAEPQLAS